MKEEFAEFLKALMEASPEIAKEKMTPNVENYINTLFGNLKTEGTLTSLGKEIIGCFACDKNKSFTTKELSEITGYSSRMLNGVLKKLVDSGHLEKFGKGPVVYCLTDKGCNCIDKPQNV